MPDHLTALLGTHSLPVLTLFSKALLGFSVPDDQPSMTAHYNKTSKKMFKFTHACMEAFMAMKFKVRNPLSWEFIMDQPIFYNKCIANPNTNQPYDRHQPSFKDMEGVNTSTCRVYSIYSLTNFPFEKYRKDPEITNNSIILLSQP